MRAPCSESCHSSLLLRLCSPNAVCGLRLSPTRAVLTDEPNNQTVLGALPVINKYLKAQDEPEEEEDDDDDDDDDDDEEESEDEDDDDEEEDDEEEDDDEDDDEEEEEIEEDVALDGRSNGVAQLTAATADLAVGQTNGVPLDEEGKDAMLREDIRYLVDSLVEDDTTQVRR